MTVRMSAGTSRVKDRLPAPHGHCSHLYCTKAEMEHEFVVIVGREGTAAPGGNLSTESVALSSSAPLWLPPPTWWDEPFTDPTAATVNLLANSDALAYGFVFGMRTVEKCWKEGERLLVVGDHAHDEVQMVLVDTVLSQWQMKGDSY